MKISLPRPLPAAPAAFLALLMALAPAPAAQPRDGDDLEEHAAVLKKLDRLRDKSREALLEKVEAALAATDAPQVKRVAELVAESGLDPAALPEATEYGPHDPEVWLGGKKRKRIKEGSSRWKRLVRTLGLDEYPPRELEALVFYDFSTGAIVRRAESKDDGGVVFRNLLRGYPPHQDLAEAWLQKQLDGEGPLRAEAEFFAHTYADLDARYYENVSLYDVWSHEVPTDVPDVDARAFAIKVHEDESLPVPLRNPHKQKWYPLMAEAVLKLQRHVMAAEALAAVWLEGEPRLDKGYSNAVSYLQAYLAAAEGDRAAVTTRFQSGSFDFIESVRAEIEGQGNAAYTAGDARRRALEAGREKVREAFLGVLRSEGILTE